VFLQLPPQAISRQDVSGANEPCERRFYLDSGARGTEWLLQAGVADCH
jgi:hypothetical protein